VVRASVGNLEWREFLNYSEALKEDQRKIIKAEFENAEYFISCIANYYDLITEIPLIRVDSLLGAKNDRSQLYYDAQDKTININSELILKYFLDKDLIEIENSRNEFLWGLAHEFFHHGRNHIRVTESYAVAESDASTESNHFRLYLEDDADCLATAALYRHFLFYVYKGLDFYDVKLKVLTALFKPIRLKIQESKNDQAKTHPAWSTRLYSQIIKLSELDIIVVDNSGKPKRSIDIQLQKNLLTEELLKMDEEFSEDKYLQDYLRIPVELPQDDENLKIAVSKYPKELITRSFVDLYYLNESHKKLDDFLKVNSYLPGLVQGQPTSKWIPKRVKST
jgi:hypothetical protein